MPRRIEPRDEVFERRRPDRAFAGERLDRLGVDVVDDAGVAGGEDRRTMLAPIRPKPIMPSCMALFPSR